MFGSVYVYIMGFRFMGMCTYTDLGRKVVNTMNSTEISDFPLLFIISRVRGVNQIIEVIKCKYILMKIKFIRVIIKYIIMIIKYIIMIIKYVIMIIKFLILIIKYLLLNVL